MPKFSVMPKIEKAGPKNRTGLCVFNPGSDLRSRAVTSAVSSALRGLTSVFGMGTGVTPAVRPPGNLNTGAEKLRDGISFARRAEHSLQLRASGL